MSSSRGWLRRAVTVALAIAVAGCGSRVIPAEPLLRASEMSVAGIEGGSSTPSGEGTPEAGSPDAGQTASPMPAGSAAAPSPSPSVNMGPQHNDGRIKITLSATCVTPGTPMTALIEVKPKSGLGMTVAYSDYKNHGAMAVAETPTGRHEWRFVVAPDAPPGEAVLLVSATDGDAGPNGGTADKRFQVVPRPGDCP